MKRLLLTIALPAALLLPVKAQPQILQSLPGREAEEQQLREEISERENRIARRLDEINRQAEEQSRRISQYFSNLDLSRGNRQQGQPAAGGLQFSTSAPARSPGKPSAAAQKAARKNQRDAEHRAWLEEKRERQREANRRRRENERRRAEAEARMREEIRQRVTAAEYMREGVRTERLSSEARYRTGEGAVMMNRMHSSHNLMSANTEKHFGQGNATAGRHRIRKLRDRKQTGLDDGAIPWGTMRANALPWEKWEQQVKETVAVHNIPPPKVTITSPELWRQLSEEIPEDRFKMIKAVIYGVNNGVFPELRKVEELGIFILDMKDENKLMTLSVDGSSLEIVTFSDKDLSWKNVKDNLRKGSLSLKTEYYNASAGLTVTPLNTATPSPIKIKAGMKNAKATLNAGEKDMELITLSDKDTQKNTVLEDKSGNQNSMPKETIASVSMQAELPLLDWTSALHRQSYNFTSIPVAGEIALGNGWSFKGGIEAKVEAKAATKVSTNAIGSEFKSSARLTLAEGGLSTTIVHKVPFYNGYCFSEVSGDVKLGYDYSYSEAIGSTNQGTVVSGRAQAAGLPLSFGAKARLFRYVSVEDIDNAFKKALESNQ